MPSRIFEKAFHLYHVNKCLNDILKHSNDEFCWVSMSTFICIQKAMSDKSNTWRKNHSWIVLCYPVKKELYQIFGANWIAGDFSLTYVRLTAVTVRLKINHLSSFNLGMSFYYIKRTIEGMELVRTTTGVSTFSRTIISLAEKYERNIFCHSIGPRFLA